MVQVPRDYKGQSRGSVDQKKTGQGSKRKWALKVNVIWKVHKKLENGQDWGNIWEMGRLARDS